VKDHADPWSLLDAGLPLLQERQRVMSIIAKEQAQNISISQITIKSC
jgi:hypothetical protein